MSMSHTGKALALSVFLHLFALAILLGELDFFTKPKIEKRIDDSMQKSATQITYITTTPKVTLPIKTSSMQPSNVQVTQEQFQKKIESEQTTAIDTITKTPSTELPIQPLKSSKYYSNEEVLEPAKPLSDWILETNNLLSGRVYQVFVQIWISETGEFEKFELIESSVSDANARLMTLNLLKTPMAPAIQDGLPVPSTRKLAILIDKDE
jgi:hypothetical protein